MKAYELESGQYYRVTSGGNPLPRGSIVVGTDTDAINLSSAEDDNNFNETERLCAVCVWSPNKFQVGYTIFNFMDMFDFERVNLVLEGLDP